MGFGLRLKQMELLNLCFTTMVIEVILVIQSQQESFSPNFKEQNPAIIPAHLLQILSSVRTFIIIVNMDISRKKLKWEKNIS